MKIGESVNTDAHIGWSGTKKLITLNPLSPQKKTLLVAASCRGRKAGHSRWENGWRLIEENLTTR